MPRFSQRSKRALKTTHPDIQKILWEVIERFDIIVLEGIRGRERQNRLKQEGRSQVEWPNSKHNVRSVPVPPNDLDTLEDEQLSTAVDIAPYPIDWDDTLRFHQMGFYVMGIADILYREGKVCHKLRWGHDWDRDLDTHDQSFNDSPHFELVGISR